jgi:hypothetical protein
MRVCRLAAALPAAGESVSAPWMVRLPARVEAMARTSQPRAGSPNVGITGSGSITRA